MRLQVTYWKQTLVTCALTVMFDQTESVISGGEMNFLFFHVTVNEISLWTEKSRLFVVTLASETLSLSVFNINNRFVSEV